MNNLLSPREKLIVFFKNSCGVNYDKMYLTKLSTDLAKIKLKSYVSALTLMFINIDNINVREINDNISLYSDVTLIRTYSIDDILNIKNENQLGLSLFIEWGYLLSTIEKVSSQQLIIAL